MTVNMSRSMNSDLAEGMSDGSYKKVVTDRGGVVEGTTLAARSNLDDVNHGIHEMADKVLGDGTIQRTPDYSVTTSPDSTRW